VIVLRVSASPGGPHRVTRDNHFYTRTSVGKAPMDVHGIRHAFAAGTALGQQIRAFRAYFAEAGHAFRVKVDRCFARSWTVGAQRRRGFLFLL